MEISESTQAVFFVSRIFGLAPYVVKRTSKGQIVDYKRNLLLVIYSLSVVFCLGSYLTTDGGRRRHDCYQKPIKLNDGVVSSFFSLYILCLSVYHQPYLTSWINLQGNILGYKLEKTDTVSESAY